MPKIFEIYGYVISIWSNENGEPVLAIQANYDEIIQYWMAYHGYITYYR